MLSLRLADAAHDGGLTRKVLTENLNGSVSLCVPNLLVAFLQCVSLQSTKQQQRLIFKI